MEFLRQKNVATYCLFPLINSSNRPTYFSGTAWGSLTNATITAYSFADNQAPALLTIGGTPTELGSTGVWYLNFSQSEMNPDSGNDGYVQVKLNADEIDEQTFYIILSTNDPKDQPDVNVTKWMSVAVTGDGDWAELQTDMDTLISRIPDTISLANINAEVDAALADIGLDHLLSAAVSGPDVADNSIIAKLVSKSATADWDSFNNTTDSLQALRDDLPGLPWDELRSAHTTTGTYGDRVLSDLQEVNGQSLNDGVAWDEFFNNMQAAFTGKINRSGDTYAHRNQADTATLFTWNLSPTGRTIS